MIKGIIIKEHGLQLILVGTDEIDEAVLKQLNGATCTLITENVRVHDKVISGGLVINKSKIIEDVKIVGEQVESSVENTTNNTGTTEPEK
jgi:hypothetical protein